MELYKKYRPSQLKSVVGNEETVSALRNMLRRDSLPHTILFYGPSGCGKTTLARIVKDKLGCHDMDFREVNSSTFRGIDSVRDIQSKMNLAPIGKCRVYLLDEAHKWTNDAQNAALKMLEDTPRHVYFLLCTTDPQKLIKAIRTRCCEMTVRLLTYSELEGLARRVAGKEKITLDAEVLDELVASAGGSARSLLVNLDKIASVDEKVRLDALRTAVDAENETIELCRALLKKASWPEITKILRDLKADPETARWSVLGYARSVLLKKKDPQAYIVIDCFKEPFYESKEAGLVAACFEAVSND